MNVENLINECKRNNPKAQKALFELHAQAMLAICIRYVKNFENAEDVMITSFQKFFEKINQFTYQGSGSERAFIKKIIINECLMFLRKRNFLIFENETMQNTIDNSESVIDKMSAEEIFNLIRNLPVGCRTVFNLHIIEDKTHKEIADVLGITEGTSKSQLSKARKMLQNAIQKNNTNSI